VLPCGLLFYFAGERGDGWGVGRVRGGCEHGGAPGLAVGGGEVAECGFEAGGGGWLGWVHFGGGCG